jgi:cell wall integrity and stress response component
LYKNPKYYIFDCSFDLCPTEISELEGVPVKIECCSTNGCNDLTETTSLQANTTKSYDTTAYSNQTIVTVPPTVTNIHSNLTLISTSVEHNSTKTTTSLTNISTHPIDFTVEVNVTSEYSNQTIVTAPPTQSVTTRPTFIQTTTTVATRVTTKQNDKGPNVGAIVGGVIGGVVGITLIGGVIYYFYRKNKASSIMPTDDIPMA